MSPYSAGRLATAPPPELALQCLRGISFLHSAAYQPCSSFFILRSRPLRPDPSTFDDEAAERLLLSRNLAESSFDSGPSDRISPPLCPPRRPHLQACQSVPQTYAVLSLNSYARSPLHLNAAVPLARRITGAFPKPPDWSTLVYAKNTPQSTKQHCFAEKTNVLNTSPAIGVTA